MIARFVVFYHDNLFNPHWGESVKITPDNTLEISMVCQGLDPRPGAPAYHAWLPASLLLPAGQHLLAAALFAANRRWEVQLHINKALAGAPAAARGAS